ncbi:hypothetical protein WJX77_005730 [Trebouxia sp. C0004]
MEETSTSRGSIRLPNGNLSPAAFSPIPRSAAKAALHVPVGSALLLPSKEPQVHFDLLWEQDVASGSCPDSACLVTDDNDGLLLCLHSSQAGRTTALQLLLDDARPKVQVAFEVDALSMAAVTATRRPQASSQAPIPPTDLLLLHSPAKLSLYVGSRHVCDIRLRVPGLGDGPSLYNGFMRRSPTAYIEAESGTQLCRAHVDHIVEVTSATPFTVTAMPRSVSDASMGLNEDDMVDCPPTRGMPDVRALADALEPPPDMASLQGAVEDRVTVVLQSGEAVRVALPFAPAGPLPKLALDALHHVLPTGLFHLLATKHLLSPGAASGHVEEEWAQMADLILGWALDPAMVTAPGFNTPGLFKTLSGEGEPPTPGAPVYSSSSDAAWENLVTSDYHRDFMSQKDYAWVASSTRAGQSSEGHPPLGHCPQADREEVWQALYALHSLYEDFKLNVLRWPLMLSLGKLLFSLAQMVSAPDYQEHYRRDLGPTALQAASPGIDGSYVRENVLPPTNIHRALHNLLQGQPQPALLPLLANKQAPCVQRTCDILELYTLLNNSNAACNRMLAQSSLASAADSASTEGAKSALAPGHAELARTAIQEGAQKLVLAMVDREWTLPDLDTLPLGVALPLREALQRCRAKAPSGWPLAAYVLIGRDDIAATVQASVALPPEGASPQSLLPLASPVSSLALATPLHHGAGGGASPKKPSLGRTPIRQPQLGTLQVATAVGRQRSRLSIGARGIGTPPDPTLGHRPIHPAPPTPPLPPPPVPSGRAGLQLTALLQGSDDRPAVARKGLTVPYTQRLQSPGLGGEEEQQTQQGKEAEQTAVYDGMEGLNTKAAKLRFGRDLRLLEVRRLLSSAEPTTVRIANAPEVGDPEMQALQQARLLALGMRTMTLPLGRGALTLGTLRPIPTEPLCIPDLCLAGRLPQQHNAVFNLDLSSANAVPGAAADVTAWPEFHNGVAAGIRLAPGGGGLTRTWVVYNKPKTPNYTHAGMLMGLGLAGHLSCLSATDLYRYLSQEHDATTVGVLLGMAASKRGTLDPVISKMLFLHIPARHPATYPELELSPLVQASALLGVGLLYQGSCHRLTAEIMMEEIGRRPGGGGGGEFGNTSTQGSAVSQDREGYALAAGLALGLITLGQGRAAVGLSDLHIEDRLRYYMIGGSDPGMLGVSTGSSQQQPASSVFGPGVIGSDPTLGEDSAYPRWLSGGFRGPADDTGQQFGVSQVVLEGKLVNLDVTSPAATLALGLMFLRTNDAAIAAAFGLPDTHFALDYVRPDLVMLRILARSLVMQDGVQASQAWVDAQMPPLIKGPVGKYLGRAQGNQKGPASGQRADLEAIGQAHISAVAGACLSIGIKFAGSANAAAEKVLRHYVLYFLKAKQQAPDSSAGAWRGLDRQALEGCLGVVALALGVVMAGTGHLPTLKLLRGLRRRLQGPAPVMVMGQASQHNYSAHMSTSLALGFLFMAGGAATFSTSPQATAALVIALFPRFPHSPTDHRCHLQAFRHLYVLAVEPRSIEAIDVDSRASVFVPLKVTLGSASQVPNVASNELLAADPIYADRDGTAHSTGSGEGVTPAGPFFSRPAPCLLPESHQVQEVAVCGPRYWPQTVSDENSGGGVEGGGALAALYRTHALYVQRKSGALSYVDDPSGVRSLLSTAFHKGSLSEHEGFDLVHLCATFSANPFIMAFAQHFCSKPTAPPSLHHPIPQPSSSQPQESGPDVNARQQGRGASGAVEELRAFCRLALYECITQEKPGSLPSYLLLYGLMQGILGADNGSGKHKVKGLTAGLPPTIALWNLKLALAYYSSSLGNLSDDIASRSSSGEEDWQPLLRPSFLEALWQKLANLWQELGFQPEEGSTHPGTALLQYAQSGSYAQHPLNHSAGRMSGDSMHSACTQEMFGSFLSLHDMPPAHQLSNALRQASKAVASLKQAGVEMEPQSDALIPLLHMLLPDATLPTVLMLANLV